eukprot:scaffold30710_cov61-Phaeocystis_antarctica.AAC.2
MRRKLLLTRPCVARRAGAGASRVKFTGPVVPLGDVLSTSSTGLFYALRLSTLFLTRSSHGAEKLFWLHQNGRGFGSARPEIPFTSYPIIAWDAADSRGSLRNIA